MLVADVVVAVVVVGVVVVAGVGVFSIQGCCFDQSRTCRNKAF